METTDCTSTGGTGCTTLYIFYFRFYAWHKPHLLCGCLLNRVAFEMKGTAHIYKKSSRNLSYVDLEVSF